MALKGMTLRVFRGKNAGIEGTCFWEGWSHKYGKSQLRVGIRAGDGKSYWAGVSDVGPYPQPPPAPAPEPPPALPPAPPESEPEPPAEEQVFVAGKVLEEVGAAYRFAPELEAIPGLAADKIIVWLNKPTAVPCQGGITLPKTVAIEMCLLED
jgi:hypothetical protein